MYISMMNVIRCGTPSWVKPLTLADATVPQVMWTQLYRPSREICAEFELEYVQFNTSRLPSTATAATGATATAGDVAVTGVTAGTMSHFRALPSASILLFLKVKSHTDVTIQFITGSEEKDRKVSNSDNLRVYEGLIMFLPAESSAHLLVTNSSNSDSDGKNSDNVSSSEYDMAVFRAHINLG